MFSPRKKHTGKENLPNEVSSPVPPSKESTPKTPLARFRKPLFSSEKKQSPAVAPSTPQGLPPTVLETIGSARKIQTESTAEPLKVYLRIRPLHDHESPELHCLTPVDDKVVRIRAPNGNTDNTEGIFTFTGVLEEETTQQDVYEVTTAPLVQAFLSGVNGMVMAYGASGSGKTHTISGYDDELGILPRTLHSIFQSLKDHHDTSETKHFLSISVLEIHNERIFDLLDDSPKRTILKIHENQHGINFVKNLKEAAVHTFQEATQLLDGAAQRRQVGATAVNSESSRSHLVITIILRQISEMSENGNGLLRESRMSIMDLAGSENNKKTKTTGLLLTESSNINKSLSVFKRCIEALKHNQEHKNRQVVPYRDSQLTQLMKEYFTNGKTCMIVNVSPSDVSETFNVLKFSAIAAHVRTSSRVNCGQILKKQMDEDSHYAPSNSIESVDEAEIREQLNQEMKQAFEKMESHFKNQMSKEAQTLEQTFAEKAFIMQQELNSVQSQFKTELSQLNQKLLRAEADLACKVAEVEHLQEALRQARTQQQETENFFQTQVTSLQEENTKLKAQVEDLKIITMKYEAPPPYQHPVPARTVQVAPPMSSSSESEAEVKKRPRDFEPPAEEFDQMVGSPMKAKRFHREPDSDLPQITSMSRSAPVIDLSNRLVGGVPIARRIRKAN